MVFSNHIHSLDEFTQAHGLKCHLWDRNSQMCTWCPVLSPKLSTPTTYLTSFRCLVNTPNFTCLKLNSWSSCPAKTATLAPSFSPLMAHVQNSYPIFRETMLVLPLKSNQNRTTSHPIHCYGSSLSFLPRLYQEPPKRTLTPVFVLNRTAKVITVS